jgi:hypothetical protein
MIDIVVMKARFYCLSSAKDPEKVSVRTVHNVKIKSKKILFERVKR